MSTPQIPPNVQEQFMKLQQAQQNLQSTLAQKQQVEVDKADTDRALEELKKADGGVTVYKHAGSILIKSDKDSLISELEDRKLLADTRSTVLQKQEARLREGLKEHEGKLNEMMAGMQNRGQ